MRFGARFLDRRSASWRWKRSCRVKVSVRVLLGRKLNPMHVVMDAKAGMGVACRLRVRECFLGSLESPGDR